MAKNIRKSKGGHKDHQNSLTPNRDNKEKLRENWLRRVGKVGCGIFVILIAMFFKIPENVRNIYLLIAIAVVGWDIVYRDIKSIINLKNGEKINAIELMVVTFTLAAIVFAQFRIAAIFITAYETIETIRARNQY